MSSISKALVVSPGNRFPMGYLGVASCFMPGNFAGIAAVSPFSDRASGLDIVTTNREMKRIFGSPRTLEPSMGLPRLQMLQVNTQSPAFGVVVPAVEAKTTQAVKKTLDTQPQKSLWQTVTQPKVLIVAGTVAAVAGAAAAYYFFPVATAAHAVTIGNTSRAVAMNTHQLFIRPGFANALFLADMALKIGVIPAAKMSLPLLLPVISTTIVTTLGTLVLLYVANQAWKAAKAAMWGAGTVVANRFSHECDQTYVGMAIKKIVVLTASPFMPSNQPAPALEIDDVAQEDEVVVQSAPLQITGSIADPSIQVITKEEAQEIEASKAKRNTRGKKATAAARARKAQVKAQSTWTDSIIRAGLVTAAAGASVYFYAKAKPDLDFVSTEF